MNSSKIAKSSKKIPWLAGFFILQLALAVVLFSWQRESPTAINEPLLALDVEKVDSIEVSSGEESVQLQKQNNQWQMGENLPVKAERVQELLSQLDNLHGGWPVATTSDAAQRFEVSDEKFKRKVQVRQGEQDATVFYLGTSPTFRQSHLRKADSENIFAVKLDEFALPTGRDAWLDVDLLQPKGEISAIFSGTQKVEKAAGKWPSESAQDSNVDSPTTDANIETAAATADAQNTEAKNEDAQNVATENTTAEKTDGATAASFDSAAFAKALADVTVLGIADKQADFDAPTTADASAQQDQQLLKFTWAVTTSEGRYEYELLRKADQYFLRRSDNPHTFRVSKAHYDALVKIQELQEAVNS